MSLKPTNDCLVTKRGGTDLYGKEVAGATFKARCSIVKLALASVKTSVRADSSGSRGNAEETTAGARLLFLPRAGIDIGDRL